MSALRWIGPAARGLGDLPAGSHAHGLDDALEDRLDAARLGIRWGGHGRGYFVVLDTDDGIVTVSGPWTTREAAYDSARRHLS